MDQPGSSYAAHEDSNLYLGESCGQGILRYHTLLVDGRRICPDCAFATQRAGKGRTLRLAAITISALAVIAAGVWLATSDLWTKADIHASLGRMKVAALRPADNQAQQIERLRPFLDGDVLYSELESAAAAAGDPRPDETAVLIWYTLVVKGIQRGRVVSIEDDRAVLKQKLMLTLSTGEVTPFEVEFEMRRRGEEDWRITHLLNPAEIYDAYRRMRPL